MSNENFLLRRVIDGRWEQGEGDLIHVELGRPYGMSLWKAIWAIKHDFLLCILESG